MPCYVDSRKQDCSLEFGVKQCVAMQSSQSLKMSWMQQNHWFQCLWFVARRWRRSKKVHKSNASSCDQKLKTFCCSSGIGWPVNISERHVHLCLRKSSFLCPVFPLSTASKVTSPFLSELSLVRKRDGLAFRIRVFSMCKTAESHTPHLNQHFLRDP